MHGGCLSTDEHEQQSDYHSDEGDEDQGILSDSGEKKLNTTFIYP